MTGFLQKNQRIVFLLLLALITLWAGWYIAVCTKYAPWGFSDSTAYFAAARNFAAGKGLGSINPDGSFSPLMIFPPFYSLVLSILAFFKADLIVSSRILDILSFSLLVASCGWLFYLITKSFWLSLSFAVLITTSPVLGVNYSSMMSEPLAIVLGIPGFLLLIYALKQDSTKWLILSACLCGLSLLTRYAFAAFPIAGVAIILFFSNLPTRKRIINVLKYGIVSFTPMMAWVILQWVSKSSIGSRHYSLSFSFIDKISQFFTQFYTVVKYWLPYRTNMIPGIRSEIFRPILLFILVGVILFGLVISIKKIRISETRFIAALNIGLATLIVCYLLVLLVTFSVSTETISIDERMLSPLIPLFYAFFLSSALVVGQTVHPKVTFPIIGIILALFFVAYNAQPFRTYPIEVGNFPNGYTSPIWKENPILNGDVTLRQDRPLISNAPDIIMFYLNRGAYHLTSRADDSGSNIFIGDKARLSDLMQAQCALIILFDPDTVQRFEQLPDAIKAEVVSSLQSEYETVFKSSNGKILADKNCY